MAEQSREESDQLPEEGPPGQVVDDAPERRDDADESAGGAGSEGHGTGHPDHKP